MRTHALMVVGLILGCAASAWGQATDGPFQVTVATKLKGSDVVRFTNTGASSTVATPQNGRLCANAYAFSTAGQLLDCCSCAVPPNALVSVPIVDDVLGGLKPRPKELVLKMMASSGGTNAADCNPATVATGSNVLVTGLLAWKGTDRFQTATLSAAELNSILTQCGIKHPSAKICASCQE